MNFHNFIVEKTWGSKKEILSQYFATTRTKWGKIWAPENGYWYKYYFERLGSRKSWLSEFPLENEKKKSKTRFGQLATTFVEVERRFLLKETGFSFMYLFPGLTNTISCYQIIRQPNLNCEDRNDQIKKRKIISSCVNKILPIHFGNSHKF